MSTCSENARAVADVLKNVKLSPSNIGKSMRKIGATVANGKSITRQPP